MVIYLWTQDGRIEQGCLWHKPAEQLLSKNIFSASQGVGFRPKVLRIRQMAVGA